MIYNTLLRMNLSNGSFKTLFYKWKSKSHNKSHWINICHFCGPNLQIFLTNRLLSQLSFKNYVSYNESQVKKLCIKIKITYNELYTKHKSDFHKILTFLHAVTSKCKNKEICFSYIFCILLPVLVIFTAFSLHGDHLPITHWT